MNDYELVYIFDSALGEDVVGDRVEALNERLTKGGGEIRVVDEWGKRRLAYPIDDHENGYYVVVQFTADPSSLSEFERSLKTEEDLLRHLIVIDEGQPSGPVSESAREEFEDEEDEDEDEDDDEEEED